METVVHTGQTQASGKNTFVSKSLTSDGGDRVLILMQIEADAATTKALQKSSLDIIKQSILEGEGDAGERLDGALKELNGLIKGMLLSKTIQDLHALIAVMSSDGTLNVSHAGRAEAYVVRGGTASQITEYTRGKPSPVFVHIASGHLESKDCVILSTQRLLRALTPAQLAQLAMKPDGVVDDLKSTLSAEKEHAVFAVLDIDPKAEAVPVRSAKGGSKKSGGLTRTRRKQGSAALESMSAVTSGLFQRGKNAARNVKMPAKGTVNKEKVKSLVDGFQRDLKDPTRRHKAHLLLLAGSIAVFLCIWALVNLSSFTQSNQTRAELETLITQINDDIRTAENRRLTGDLDAANTLLRRADQNVQQVMGNESQLFRNEALELAGLIRTKREEINNIIRLTPKVVVNLASKKPNITSIGMIGLEDEELIVYDRQDLYRVINNSADDPDRLSNEELILHGTHFPRYQTNVFQMTGNRLVEIIAGQPSSMKTEDPAGWITGKDIETFSRFIYVLSPENNQIYKYERLSNRYAAPSQYNVNGELANALDMSIDVSVFVLKEGGEVVKLLRGETEPFTIRYAPENVLQDAVKLYKVPDGKLYFLDSKHSRVVVITEGNSGGEYSYLRQYVLDSAEVGELKDLFVDSEERNLYVLDEKQIYKVELKLN